MENGYTYRAFISYRHKPPDIAAAKAIHTGLENYRVPAPVRKKTGFKKVGRCFRDREELPTSSDLAQDIVEALQNSEWLIVVCTPDTPESKWCETEIETFIRLHGRSRVLAVLAAGEPEESFPDVLRFETLPDGTRAEHEPLAADLRAGGAAGMRRKLRTEKLRLLAPMLGVGFDDLRRRARERTLKIAVGASAAVALFFALFGGYALSQAATISRQNSEIAQKNDDLTAQIGETNKQKDLAQANEAEAVKQAGIAQDNEARAVAGETEAKRQAGIAQDNAQLAQDNEAEANRQAGIARDNAQLAQDNEAEALRQTGIAQTNEQLAKTNEAEANRQAGIARDNEQEAISQRNGALIGQSKFLASLSAKALGLGDPSTAALLALEALPQNLEDPERPLVYEAETALRNAGISRNAGEFSLTGGVQTSFGAAWQYLDGDKVLAVNRNDDWFYYQLPGGGLMGRGPELDAYCPERSLIASKRGSYSTGYYTDIYALSDLSKPVLSVPCDSRLYHVKFCPDGRYFVRYTIDSADETNFAELVETDTGKRVYSITDLDFFPEDFVNGERDFLIQLTGTITDVDVSPDGRYLGITLYNHKDGNIFLYDLTTGKKVRDFIESNVAAPLEKPDDWDDTYNWDDWRDLYATTLPWNETVEDPNGYEYLMFSPNGEFVCARTEDKIYAFSVATGHMVGCADINTEAVDGIGTVDMLFSPDSKYFVILNKDRTISIYDTSIWQITTRSNDSLGPISYIGFTGDETLVFQRGATSPELSFMPISYGSSNLYTINIPNLYIRPAWNSSAIQAFDTGFVAFSQDGVYQLWEKDDAADVGKLFSADSIILTNKDTAKGYSPDGKRVAVGQGDEILIFDTQTLELLGRTEPVGYRYSQLIWSPDGSQILCVDYAGNIYLYDSASCGLIKSWPADYTASPFVTVVAAAPDWSLFAVNNPGHLGGMYDLKTYEQLYAFPDDYNWSLGLTWGSYAFSPDGKRFYTFSSEALITTDARSGAIIGSLPYINYKAGGLAVSPDGKRLVFGAQTDTNSPVELFVVDLASGAELWRADVKIDTLGEMIVWSPDGQYIAAADNSDGETTVFGAATGAIVWQGYGDAPSFSADSESIALRRGSVDSGSLTNTIGTTPYEGVVLEIKTGREFAKLPAPGVFSPDGSSVLMQNAIWRVKPLDQLMLEARQRLGGRQLTDEERSRYFIS